MPEEDSRVHIYFPTHDEADVKAEDESISSSYNQRAEGHLGTLAEERIYERALAEKQAQEERQIQKGMRPLNFITAFFLMP